MRPLQSFVEQDAMASLAETVPEFDILNGGERKALRIEAPEFLEHRPTDSATSGPERRRFRIPVLMHKMVQQVAVSGYDASSPRLRIIRTKDGGHFRMLGKYQEYTVYSCRCDDDVGVDEEEDVPLRVTRAVIACRRWSRVLRQLEHTCTKLQGHCWGIIRGRIVHHDDLSPRTKRGAEASQALSEVTRIVKDRHNNRNTYSIP
jgi:hypothetical protein